MTGSRPGDGVKYSREEEYFEYVMPSDDIDNSP